MGRKLDIEDLRGRAEVGSNSQVSRIEVVNLGLDQIVTREPFESLFPIQERVLEAVIASIRKRGFDPHDAPEATRETTTEGTKYLLLDGHTRVRAARELQLSAIPVRVVTFANEDEALWHAIHKQTDRRNLDDRQVMRVLSLVDKKIEGFRGSTPLAPNGANGGAEGKSAARTARSIGVSARKIERARKVTSYPDVAAQVERGEISINAGYELVRARERGPVKSGGEGEEGQLVSPTDITGGTEGATGADEKLSAENLAKKGGNTERANNKGADWTWFADRVRAATGATAKIDVDDDGVSGRLIVSFSGAEELNRLVERLCKIGG